MALISRNLFRNWWDDIDRYHREVEEHFEQIFSRRHYDPWRVSSFPSYHDAFRPWRRVFNELDYEVGGSTTIEQDDNKYKMVVDVQQFAPEEITVRTDDKYITIEAKHEQKKNRHGYVAKEFKRRYLLPKGYDIGHVKPSLSSDGILTIIAPKFALPALGERIVPIRRSFLPAIKAT